jgi:hypothetical protein
MTVTLTSSGIRKGLLSGQRLRIQNLKLDISAVAGVMGLAQGWSGKIALGIVGTAANGSDMWGATYPKSSLTVAATRGNVSIQVADLSVFTIGGDILLHDTTRIWDADGSICSEGATVIDKSAATGAGAITLGGCLRSSYTTAATVRPYVGADVELDNVELVGGGVGADQDGIWVWGIQSIEAHNLYAEAIENRPFSFVNNRFASIQSIRGERAARNGLGYLITTSGTDQVIVDGLRCSNCRHGFASGRAPGGSQMQSSISISNAIGDGMQDCLINAHPGVYSMLLVNCQTRGAINAGTNGDALVIFQGTHLQVSNARSGPARRHGVVIESFGHLDEGRGHTYRLSNVTTEAGTEAVAQYGFTFSDIPCVASNGFTGATSSPVDFIDLSSCDFVSRSGCLVTVTKSLIRELRIGGGSCRSVGPAQFGHGIKTDVTGTGRVGRVISSGTTYQADGGGGYYGAYFAGRAGAPIKVDCSGAATRGSNTHGLVIENGTLTYSPLDAEGNISTAVFATTGGTLTAY